ncbi:FAD-dependent monooxygenase [Microtetraspora malaysiensis]|uniref:FAD-dependent monooxygenase n=1 Tax=Microtetraspora malaysiensis TaxID=161358 RepID=UPI003D92B5B5
MSKKVLISGASIAGQTLAYWLTKHGFQVTVVERSSELRVGGQGVDVRDQALDVVERMGILPRIRAAVADVREMEFVDATGRRAASVELANDLEIMRGDLVKILYGVTEDDVDYVFGDSIKSLAQDSAGVTVAFQSGDAGRFDLVIGADGLHSNVRRLAFGPESEFLDYKGYYFAFGNADAALGVDRTITMFNRPGKMAGIYRSGNHAQAKAYFMFRRPEPMDYDHRDLDEQRRLLKENFAGETSWQVPELLDGALADPDLYFDALTQVRMPSWSVGRVALVGDAAYCASPASGAGAELALTGAYRLAAELAGGDHQEAFRRYEEQQRELVDIKLRISDNLGLMAPETQDDIDARNAALTAIQ